MSPRTALARVRTADGWTLTVHRFIPAHVRRKTPALLLHGFGANGWCFRAPAGRSLGWFLAERGIDVWIPELRGTRSSGPPEGRGGTWTDDAARREVTFSAKLTRDLPALLDHVRQAHGGSELDVVGHSLGGTLLFAHLATEPDVPIRRVVALAASVRYGVPMLARAIAAAEQSRLPWRAVPNPIPLRLLCRLGAYTRIVLPAHEHFNVANVERATLLRMMKEGVEDATLAELAEIVRWGEGDTGGPWGRSLLESLGQVRAPLLLLGGAADRHVRPAALREVLGAWGSVERRLLVLGRNAGCELDYGHTDLLLGARAPRETFPLIAEWLEA